MKTVVATSLALSILGLSGVGASAMSCTQRHKECLGFCETSFKNRPACPSQCADAVPRCMQDGCWVTRMANKCGYTKS